jgi:hypothetical protein
MVSSEVLVEIRDLSPNILEFGIKYQDKSGGSVRIQWIFYESDGTSRNQIFIPQPQGEGLLEDESTWYHMVVRYESASSGFHFRIGKASKSFPNDYSDFSITRNSASTSGFRTLLGTGGVHSIRFGRGIADSVAWRGNICEWRLWEEARINSELNEFSNDFIPTPQSGLHYVKMNEASGTATATDPWSSLVLNYTLGAFGKVGDPKHPFAGGNNPNLFFLLG